MCASFPSRTGLVPTSRTIHGNFRAARRPKFARRILFRPFSSRTDYFPRPKPCFMSRTARRWQYRAIQWRYLVKNLQWQKAYNIRSPLRLFATTYYGIAVYRLAEVVVRYVACMCVPFLSPIIVQSRRKERQTCSDTSPALLVAVPPSS